MDGAGLLARGAARGRAARSGGVLGLDGVRGDLSRVRAQLERERRAAQCLESVWPHRDDGRCGRATGHRVRGLLPPGRCGRRRRVRHRHAQPEAAALRNGTLRAPVRRPAARVPARVARVGGLHEGGLRGHLRQPLRGARAGDPGPRRPRVGGADERATGDEGQVRARRGAWVRQRRVRPSSVLLARRAVLPLAQVRAAPHRRGDATDTAASLPLGDGHRHAPLRSGRPGD